MRLSKRTLALVWALSVAVVSTGGWFWLTHSGDPGKPLVLPGQSPTVLLLEEVRTCLFIFFGTGVPTALIVYWRPGKREF